MASGEPPSSAVTAREEIGRAVAARIREIKDAKGLSRVVEDVLPRVEKFLESPAERRLRRIRTGVVTTGIGLGALVFFSLIAVRQINALPVVGVGAVAFLIGLAYLINGWHFSAQAEDRLDRATREEDLQDLLGGAATGDASRYIASPPSVVESTTRHLEDGATSAARPRATGE